LRKRVNIKWEKYKKMRKNRDILKSINKKKFLKMEAFDSITLAAQEADTFIDTLIDQSVLKNNVRVVKHDSETKNIRAIGFGTDEFLYPESQFSAPKIKGTSGKPFVNQLIPLSTVTLKGALAVADSDLEDGIEGPAFTKHLMDLVTKKMSNQLELFYYAAESQAMSHNISGFANDSIMSLLDGWRFRIDNSQLGEAYYNNVTGSALLLDASNTITARKANYTVYTTKYIAEENASAPYDLEFKYGKMIDWIPTEYANLLPQFKFYNHPIVTNKMFEFMEKRATALGDAIIMGAMKKQYRGLEIVDMPLMPLCYEVYSAGQHENYDSTLAITAGLTDVLLTIPNNLIVNFQREIKIEPERSAFDSATYFVYTIRTGCSIEDVHKCILLKRVEVA
jgi:hypothetical protein